MGIKIREAKEEGFVLGESSSDEAIGEKQYRMMWKKRKSKIEKEGST